MTGRACRAAAVVALLAVVAPGLATATGPGVAGERWREPLARAERALAGGDAREAERAWEESHRAAIRSGSARALIDVAVAHLGIGEAARGRQKAVERARRTLLLALFQARERRDHDSVAAAAEAFAILGDRDIADRAFAVALALAEQKRDALARERIAAMRLRVSGPPPAGPAAER